MNIAVFINHDIVGCWQFTDRHAALLRQLLPDCQVTLCLTPEQFTVALPEAEAVLTWTFRQEWFALAPRLRVLSTPAAGKDYFHVSPPPQVTMLNGHFHGEIIGETVVGMILAMVRGLLPNVTSFAGQPWARAELSPRLRPLRGASITILGFGHIGRWIGRLLKPFGTHICGLSRHADAPRPDWFDQDDRLITEADLPDVLPHTDHLVLALPSTTGTDHFLNAARLALLPSHATITNIGRGNAIDEDALMLRLRQGLLLGAVLDVFATEPLPADSPLLSCPNLWTLPHASAIADNYLELYVREVAIDLQPFLH